VLSQFKVAVILALSGLGSVQNTRMQWQKHLVSLY